MKTLNYSMKRWTTEELIGEVVSRTAADGPALRLVEGMIIRARLAAGDRLRDGLEPRPAVVAKMSGAAVRGTTEMGLADDNPVTAGPPEHAHKVDAETPDAHAHDHTHGKRASWRLSAHEHAHVHRGEAEADGAVNGHVHAGAHAALPWEDAERE